jgi:hypothetical protein
MLTNFMNLCNAVRSVTLGARCSGEGGEFRRGGERQSGRGGELRASEWPVGNGGELQGRDPWVRELPGSGSGGGRGRGGGAVPAAAEEQYRGGGAVTSPTRIGREEETGVEIEQC